MNIPGSLRGLCSVALAGSAVCLLPTAASAHFVWLESAPQEGGVHACFGEYPTLREGAPLLDKVSRVKVYAVTDAGRRELTAARQTDHFRYDGMAQAPVAAADLTYGVIQRDNTSPFLLRYESELLVGNGKPLPAAEIARLSTLKTELPLQLRLQPAGAGRLAIAVTAQGKPVPAMLSLQGPKDHEMHEQPVTDGKLELSVADGGWYHLRLKVEDEGPVSYEGKDARQTRTYFSVMFQAAGAAPSAAGASEKRADADAVKLLDEAHAARAHWSDNFPGFTADAVYQWNGKSTHGTITVKPDFTVEYALEDKTLVAPLKPSFDSLVMHRQGGNPTYAATWHDGETHALGRAIDLNDNLGSFYRVRDRQIMQVNRVMGSQRFTNNVILNQETKLGFLPRIWSIAYYETATNHLLRASTTSVTWSWIGDVFVPETLETSTARDQGTDVSRLILSNWKLLSK